MSVLFRRRSIEHGRPSGHDDSSQQGMALITSLLIMLLCAIVVTGVLQLASHTAQRSGLNRDRNAALNAAQAGIQSELSLISDGTCPTSAGAETILPDQFLPTESYIIQAPVSCTPNGPAVIVATGYVPNATRPTSTTTMVAHINRNQGAPVSAGANGGYDFPDALFADGALSAPAGLNLYGSGGSIPTVTADTISIGSAAAAGSQLGGALAGRPPYGQNGTPHGAVTVWASQIGGPVTGTKVALANPSASLTVQGGVAATGDVSLNNTTVNGTLSYGGSYTRLGTSNVSGTVSAVPTSLPLSRPLGRFDGSNPANVGTTLGVGTPVGTAVTSCPSSPAAWTSNFYNCSSAPAGYNPGIYNSSGGNTVIMVQGPFTVDVPQTAVGGQLYVIDAGGGAGTDNLTITGHGSTLPVFAFTDGTLNLSGTLVGQVAAHSISVTGPTSMTFAPPTTPMPDIAFPTGYTAPDLTNGGRGYISTVAYEYQCPGASAC